MYAAERAGKNGAALQAIEDEWLSQAQLKLFDDVVIDAINASSLANKESLIKKYKGEVKGKSNSEARSIATGILGSGANLFFDWDAPRSREGYYRLRGGCDCAINRAIAYAPYADLIWMESKLPDFEQAKQFAAGVHAVWPNQK